MFCRARPFLALPLFAALVLSLGQAPAQTKKDKKDVPKKDGPKAVAGAVFELYQDKGGDYRFRFKSGDAILAIAPRGFDTKEAARTAVADIQREAARARVVEVASDEKSRK